MRARGSRISILLLTLVLFLSVASSAQAVDCSDYPGGVIDGFAGTVPPSQLQIDQTCTIKNFPASNPLSTNFSFLTQPGQTDERWLIVFDNVVHTGQMACNSVAGHTIWFVNGSSSSIQEGCQNLLIPVEKIDKENPPGQTTAAIGVPFTYSLTIPVLYDPATGNVINSSGSPNDLHSVTVWDDLNATGADLTYLSHVAYLRGSGAPAPHTFSNVGGLLTFDNFPIIPAGDQIVIEITVVLNDTPANAPGTQFVNTAKWDFGRLIDGVFYEPLPGEWGVTPSLTIAAPELVVTKSGPATLGLTLNLGQWGEFALDVQNTGLTDAWNVTVLDRLPDGATGGMCNMTPQLLSAQVLAADGVTPVPGKGPLVPGTDFSVAYTGAPTCELALTMLTPAGVIGPNERLILSYRTQLDADSQDGATLTNVAGATEWFNGNSGNPDRQSFTRPLTDGSVGVSDHEDAHTVTVALYGYFYEKTVANLTSGMSPATIAAPGDVLRYTLRLQATDVQLDDLTFYDDLGALNAVSAFVSGTLTLLAGTLPPGADVSNIDPIGGTNGAGIIDIRNLSVAANSEILIQFDITLDPTLADGTVVLNQADLISTAKIADSDDPNINGQSDPDVAGDEDPTQVVIGTVPVGPLLKENTQATAAIGEAFSYRITAPETPYAFPIYDVQITDDLTASAADLRFLSVTKIAGSEPWNPVNTGSATNLVIEDPAMGIDIPAGEQVVVEVTVVLEDTPTNVPGLTFTNTADYTYSRIDGSSAGRLPGSPRTTPPMTIVGADLTLTKSGPATMTIGAPETFTLDVQNAGDAPAWNMTLTDLLPDGTSGGMCDGAPTAITVQVFEADGSTPASGVLAAGTDYSVAFTGAPTCQLALTVLTTAGTIGPGQRLIATYETALDTGTQNGVTLTNVSGATEWFSADASSGDPRTYTRTVTDGSVGVLDHEDAHAVSVALPAYLFEKTVANLTSGADPATTAEPGDTLRYRLSLESLGDVPLDGLGFFDELDALNGSPAFEPGTLTLVTVPAGADTTNTTSTGGAQGTGVIDLRNLSLAGAGSSLLIEFDVTLATTLRDGTLVTNQSQMLSNGAPLALSDDPDVNGPADPFVAGDEDPTQVRIQAPPAEALFKENLQTTAAVGAPFSYRITVPETPYAFPMYDVRIADDLAASAADLRFLSVTRVAGSEPWTPVNTGTTSNLAIEDPATGISIPAGEQIVVEIAVVLENTPTNVAGLTFTNTADFTYNWIDDDDTSQLPGLPGTTAPMTIVEPGLTLEKTGPATMTLGAPATYSLDLHNTGGAPAWNSTLTDRLPDGATGGTCDMAPSAITAQVFQSDGVTPVSAPLVQNTDFAVSFNGTPACEMSLSLLSAAGTIGPDQRLIVTYQPALDADSQNGATLTNIAGATEWFSADGSSPDRRSYTRALSDGTVGVLDHEDAHTVTVALPAYLFEKTVANLTTGADPATTATPGDRLRYRLRLESLSDIPLNDLSLFDELDALNSPAAFEPGSLLLVSVPPGADTTATDPTGGANGTGVIDIRNLSLSGVGSTLLIEFEITLAPVLADGTQVANQSQLLSSGSPFALSDDPNVNGQADPFVADDEDPTRLVIGSAPNFRVEKISAYVSGDPNVLLAGETLRYTITIKNIGTADAVDAVLQDAIPVNTRYVAGSTTLNGSPVSDGPSGIAPLSNGIQIHAPGNPTPGAMRADASAAPNNVATVVFDVVVDANLIDGTVIVNQAFVSAIQGGVANQPSDDPRTPIPDDPTRDVVGNSPLLFAPKIVNLLVDAGAPGIVDPNDVLHYTITVYNTGAIAATGAVLTDTVPANTTYVADSTTLNGLPVGQPDGGISPLMAGIPISSADLTPPLPSAGAGSLTPGESAVIEFDLQVNAGVPGGTIISNQAGVRSNELPNLLTDGDGNPATGPEPTRVVVGDGQQLSITKQVAVVGGGPALAGSQLEYVVSVFNIAAVPAYGVVITDDLDAPTPGQLAYVNASATMNGSPVGVTINGSIITADHFDSYGPLQPGESAVLRFRAVIDSDLSTGTTVTNTGVVTWNTPPDSASASVSVDVGGMPGVGALNGRIWHDSDFDGNVGGSERLLSGWSVDLYRNGQQAQSAVSDAGGTYRIGGMAPNDVNGDRYELRFTAPDAGGNTASLGTADSPFTNGPQRITAIAVRSGSNLQDLDLPIQPNGVVYDAIQRVPIPRATLTLLSASGGIPLPSLCFDDPIQQGQVTGSDGYYKFDLNFSDPGCPSGGNYLIGVTAPGSGYVAGYSQMIPPTSAPSTGPLSVPACPGGADDAVPSTPQHCEAQPSELAPPPAVAARTAGTNYHVHLTLDGSRPPGSSQIFNNHIPLDPVLDGAVAITKATSLVNVSRGQLVPYEIVVSNELGAGILDLSIVDRFPAGFRYVEGSAQIDGEPVEPTINGQELVWSDIGVGGASRRTLALLLAVGAGVSEGEYINRAQAFSSLTGSPLSGEAHATVRLVPDPTFDCTDVIGKVFDDVNRDGFQDPEEPGLRGIRLLTARGLAATTDQHGRFHITCAITPHEGRGSNFILKLDDRTLPTGYRMSTRQAQVMRATRGKALRFSFGASIHRVVGLDMANGVFEPNSTAMRPQWKTRIGMLLEELKKAPATLRLSYLADVEDARLVEERLAAVKKEIADAWEALNCCYPLTIEPEVFWRRGAPPDRDTVRMPEER